MGTWAFLRLALKSVKPSPILIELNILSPLAYIMGSKVRIYFFVLGHIGDIALS